MTPQLLSALGRSETELPPMPIEPGWILAGQPQARGQILLQSADRCVASGFWECTPGRFRWEFAWDEFVYVLRGRVTIVDEQGATCTLGPGDTAHFARGLTTIWQVEETVRKYFVLRTPEPLEV